MGEDSREGGVAAARFMGFELDIRTLLVVTALMRGAQALALALTWLAHRSHPPARHWAVGSAITAVGILLAATRDGPRASLIMLLTNTCLIVGSQVFYAGIVEATGGLPHWRRCWARSVAGVLACSGFIWVWPSLIGRLAVLLVVVIWVHIEAIAACLRHRGQRASLSFRLLAVVMALQSGFTLWMAVDAWRLDMPNVLAGGLPMRLLLLSVLLSSLLVTALLILITSQGLQEQLESLAAHDPLTGVMNRRAFATVADAEWTRARRHRGVLVCLVLDLDHFKRLNDTQGHAVGDHALVAVADTLRSELRAQDVLCRHGGEEFVCLLPDTTEAQGLVAAERMREAVARVALGEGVPPLTVSIGVAQSSTTTARWMEVLAAADAALYVAKSAGRNCCIAASTLRAA